MQRTLALSIVATIAITLTLSAAGTAVANGAFRARLNGGEEVPPVDSDARGTIVVVANPNGVSYNLVVNNARDVVAAHIHCAPAGVNGPVGVTLFLGSPVTTNGVLAQGPILAPDTANGCGWADLDDLIAALESGDAYVNVHTLSHLPGEIRGQLD
jgi:hypothetical protein